MGAALARRQMSHSIRQLRRQAKLAVRELQHFAHRAAHERKEELAFGLVRSAADATDESTGDLVGTGRVVVELLGPEFDAEEFDEMLHDLLPIRVRANFRAAQSRDLLDRFCTENLIRNIKPAAGRKPALYRTMKR